MRFFAIKWYCGGKWGEESEIDLFAKNKKDFQEFNLFKKKNYKECQKKQSKEETSLLPLLEIQ